MAEEKEQAEEKKEKQKPEEKKAETGSQDEGKEGAKEDQSESKPSHQIKITRMSLKQVEKAISETNKKMGGLHSRYARALLERKEFLMRYQ